MARTMYRVRIHKGALVHSMRTGQTKPAGRTYVVTAWVDKTATGTRATWAGSGGYWTRSDGPFDVLEATNAND